MNALNGNLTQRVVVDTAAMDWIASPSATVHRKRLHLVGAAETGQVTSIVRFEPGANFANHEHPDGEEIFVLDGVFSDHSGDWPAGTYLLNPEGFSHAPQSTPGCQLFVKLRQSPGVDRSHVALDSGVMSWASDASRGIDTKLLYEHPNYPEVIRLERWSQAYAPGVRRYANGVELYVIEGAFDDEHGHYDGGTWMRLPAGTAHTPACAASCLVWVKEGGLIHLRDGGSAD